MYQLYFIEQSDFHVDFHIVQEYQTIFIYPVELRYLIRKTTDIVLCKCAMHFLCVQTTLREVVTLRFLHHDLVDTF